VIAVKAAAIADETTAIADLKQGRFAKRTPGFSPLAHEVGRGVGGEGARATAWPERFSRRSAGEIMLKIKALP